ncbi:MAG: competence protein ComEC, partial [Maribacter sp.]
GNYIWTLMSVSLAAQIATIPISLYYFHQFPTYFLLSGLVVIPAASIIMAVGLGTLLLSAVPYTGFITSFLGGILYWVIWFVNSIIFFLGKMPFNIIENISISFFEMILGYIIIGLIITWLSKDSKRYLSYALWALVLFGFSHSARQIKNKHKEEIVFYDTNGTIIDYINKGKRITYKSENITEKNEFYATEGYRIDAGFYQESKIDFFEKNNFIQIADKRFFILSEDYWDIQSSSSIAVDGIIIQNNPYINFAALVEEFDFQFIIADGSNYESNVEKWRGLFNDTDYAQTKASLNTLEVIETPFYYTKEKAVIIE